MTYEPPHFFQKDKNDVKHSAVKPQIDIVTYESPYAFQQDEIFEYTIHLVQNWVYNNTSIFWNKELWPQCSPNLDLVYYFVLNVINRHSNKSTHYNVMSLKATIEELFTELVEDVKMKAILNKTE